MAWKLTPLLPSRDRSALTVAQYPSAVHATSISSSPLIWVESPLWQEARKHLKYPRVSGDPWDVGWGLIFPPDCGCVTVRNHLALFVVPSGMPHVGPDMSPRDAPSGCLRWGSGYSGIWILRWGLVLPTWLLQAGDIGFYRRIYQPTLGRNELPAALCS